MAIISRSASAVLSRKEGGVNATVFIRLLLLFFSVINL